MTRSRISVLLTCLACACTGTVPERAGGDPDDRVPSPGTPRPGQPTAMPPGATNPAPPPAVPPPVLPPSGANAADPGPRVLRRLTHAQYANTVKAALGVDPTVEDLLGSDRSLDGFANGAHQAAPSTGISAAYAAAAQRLAQAATAAGKREALFDATRCGDQAACLDAFVRRQARRLFRRPPLPDELLAILPGAQQEATAGKDFWAGASYALEVMLQSVPFLYVVDTGEKDPARPGLLRRDPYSLATRLSLLLWNSGPDDALLDEAAAGRLKTAGEVEAQVGRMLGDARVNGTLRHFFREWLGYDLATRASKDAVHADYKPELVRAFVAETDRLVDQFVAGNRPVMDIFDGETAATDPEVRRFYGASDQRRGILGHASFIAANSGPGNPSPTLRGLGVLRKFFCGEIAEPPPNAPAELPESQDKVPRTIRERTELYMLSSDACNYCHKLMDPVGFLFERFDAIGKQRTHEAVAGAPGGVKPVDDTGAILFAGLPRVQGLPGLAAALSTNEKATACMLQQALRWSLGRDTVETDTPTLERLRAAHAMNGGTFRSVMAAIATSDAVRYMRGDQ